MPGPSPFRPTRRDLLVVGAGVFVVGALPLASRRRERLVRRQVPVMGTIAEVAVVGTRERRAQAAIDAALDALAAVERRMTLYRDDSDVGRANREAARRAVRVHPSTATVLREAARWAEATDGAFDPCLGRAALLWDVGRRREPPAPEEVRALAGRRLHRALDVGRRGGVDSVRFADPDAALDLGGIAKGYGVDRAVEALRAHGVGRGLVNVGGDLYALGRSEDGDAWAVGVRSPQDPSRLAATLEVEDAAVATSGDYVRYFRHDGRRYHHLLDPATGAPRDTARRSVTVRAETCTTADAGATTAFGLGPAAAAEVLERLAPEARVVHQA